jgi:hypothetical protein
MNCPRACQSINRINCDLFSLFQNFQHSNWRNGVCKRDFIIIKSNYFQKGEFFLNDFEALVREIDVRG